MTLDCNMSAPAAPYLASSAGKGKARADSPSHSQAVTQAQIQGIDISRAASGAGGSGSGSGSGEGGSAGSNTTCAGGSGLAPGLGMGIGRGVGAGQGETASSGLQPGFRHVPRQGADVGSAHGIDSKDGHGHAHDHDHGEDALDHAHGKEAFVDGGDGRTLCVRHQMMADQGVNGKLQKVGRGLDRAHHGKPLTHPTAADAGLAPRCRARRDNESVVDIFVERAFEAQAHP